MTLKHELLTLTGRCEFCGRQRVSLDQHEVARGAMRRDAREERFASMLLCRDCHDCLHGMGGAEQRACGLALIQRSRLCDYDLNAFYTLTGRNEFPSRALVDLWTRRLSWPS